MSTLERVCQSLTNTLGLPKKLEEDEEKGNTTWYVLTKVAEEKSFDVDSVDVFVESSKTPFPIDTPTYAFARRNLHVKANKQQAKTEETPLNKQHNNDDVWFTSKDSWANGWYTFRWPKYHYFR